MLPGYREHMENINAPHIRWRTGPRLRMCGTLNAAAVEEAPATGSSPSWATTTGPGRPAGTNASESACPCGPGIVYGNDLLQGEIMATAVAMTSDIVTTLGYMAPPALIHLCLDLVWMDWGRGMGRITYLGDVILEHMHPANGKAEIDAYYIECNSSAVSTADATTYYDYRDNGGLHADLEKLRALIEETA